MTPSLLLKLREKHRKTLEERYRKCFDEHGKNDVCHGMIGGTSMTDFLDEGCIDCPYLELIVRRM